ncbi:hypothetical protein MKX01_003269 [Papaver californicum]|nr:hypothetical protein MKX01_003269 [Papaver californicum]
MGCKINSFPLSKIFTKTPKLLLTSIQTKQKSLTIVSSSLSQNHHDEPITTTTQAQPAPKSTTISINFDIHTLYIPPLNSKTTGFLGLPLPTFLKIEILPELFQGVIDEQTGKLTSEESLGSLRKGKRKILNKEGKCRLVGVATVEPIDDFFMNTFLGLPTECLADMNATIAISSS